MNYSFHPHAEKELEGAQDYYDGVKEQLGDRFRAEVEVAIERILKFPDAWQPKSKSTRRYRLFNYTEFGDLVSIIGQNWVHFEDHLQSLEWVRQIISTLERSRNVIMHSGDLEMQDVERIGTSIRDWIHQVGA
jgi:hypothetical protein